MVNPRRITTNEAAFLECQLSQHLFWLWELVIWLAAFDQLLVGGFTLFIALSPWWDRALVTTHGNFWCYCVRCNWIIVGSLAAQNNTSTKLFGFVILFKHFRPLFI